MKAIIVSVAVVFFVTLCPAQVRKESKRVLLETENHIVTVSVKGESVVFKMEAITDFTMDRDSTKPLGLGWDYAGIRIDLNNNNVIDYGIDVAFGTLQKTNIFCPQYIIRENASTTCGALRSKGSVKVGFEATGFQKRPHPIYEYAIPIAELNGYGGKIGLVFKFGEPRAGTAFYPSRGKPFSFDETIQLDLAEL